MLHLHAKDFEPLVEAKPKYLELHHEAERWPFRSVSHFDRSAIDRLKAKLKKDALVKQYA